MTSVERTDSPLWWRVAETMRSGWREFLAVNPPMIIVTTVVPRMALMALFFTMLGSVIAGPGQHRYAFVGGLAMAVATTNVLYVAQVPSADKEFATFWRLRTGRLHPVIAFVVRALPYPIVVFAILIVCVLVVGPLTGLAGLAIDLLPLLGIYLLISFTSTAAGLTAGAFAVGRRNEVLVTNVVGYLIMLCSGVFMPPGRVKVIDAIGTVLPARHGVTAIHAALAGRPWLHLVIAEAATGLGWLAVMTAIVLVQIRRAAKQGHDDFE